MGRTKREIKPIKHLAAPADDLFRSVTCAMISIRKTISDLDEYRQQRDLAFECYLAAIRNTAHYAIELDDGITTPHRKHLTALAEEVTGATLASLEESRGTFRGLLRDYHDKVSHYVADLREQLAGTARALQQIVDSLVHSDGDDEIRMRSALATLRRVVESPEAAPLRSLLSPAVENIQQSLEQARQEHEITIAQFQVEIRVLHKRIDALESAASVDALTKLFTRREIEERIRSSPSSGFCLLLIKVTGLRIAELDFSPEVGAELASAFSRRLTNSLPEGAVTGRWSEEEFIAITKLGRLEGIGLATHIADHLSGSYACLQAGKTVRPSLQLRVGVVDSVGDNPEGILARIAEILTGKQ
jgi:GGDEF domain-containing protein